MIEAQLKSNLRALVTAFVAKSGISPTETWRKAARDGHFLARVESGGGFTVRNYDSIVQWFSDNWPDGAEWPSNVSRPKRIVIEAA
jgi:hypothetical protein